MDQLWLRLTAAQHFNALVDAALPLVDLTQAAPHPLSLPVTLTPCTPASLPPCLLACFLT